jgi:hypothetical protein
MRLRRWRFAVVAPFCAAAFRVLAAAAGHQRVTQADIATQRFLRSFDHRPLEQMMQGLS